MAKGAAATGGQSEYVGRSVSKEFPSGAGVKAFSGKVTHARSLGVGRTVYHIKYEDGDEARAR
jgi:hypothetical protein